MSHLLKDLKEAIAGSEQDFTQGHLGRAIFLLAVPMVLEMAMESVFAVVDIYFVSRLGADAVATVGITESMITIIYAISIGFSVATTAMVSRRIGEHQPEQASRVAFQAILTGLCVSLLIAVPGYLAATKLLGLMGVEPEVVRTMSGYTRVMLAGNTVIMLLFIINAIFRSAGDAAISMRVLWMANLLNIVLDPLLIFGWGPIPALGVTGAAIATNTGRGLAVVYQFYVLFRGHARVRLARRHIAVHLDTIKQLIRLALGGIGQSIIATSSWIGLMRIVSTFGNTEVAGYTIAIRIIIFALLPCWGLANAAATLVGQNLGAQEPIRAEKSVWIAATVNAVFMGSIGLILMLWPGTFIRLFIDELEVIARGTVALRIVSAGFLAYGTGMVLVQSLNGAGDTATPTKINFFCFWLFEIPLAYVLALNLKLGAPGVFSAIVAAESAMAISAFFLFKRGRWKVKQV